MQLPAFTLHPGDCLESLRAMPDNSIDSIVTDPPYGLAFMGKRWDYDVPSVEIWAECLRVLKPGGHLLAFAGTRTQHRMAVRIEDAGFEIRDMIAWLYGSGFPKSLDVSKAIDKAAGAERERVAGPKSGGMAALNKGNAAQGYRDAAYYDDGNMMLSNEPATEAARQWQGWGTALKPALEPITVARKPLSEGTVAANVLQHGTGAINVDGCRVPTEPDDDIHAKNPHTVNKGSNEIYGAFSKDGSCPAYDPSAGRWPANLIHSGEPEVLACFPNSNGSGPARTLKRGQRADGDGWGMQDEAGTLRDAGTGSAARFFYCAKASKRDRDEGLDSMPTVTADPYGQHRGRRMEGNDTRIDGKPPAQGKNNHPTVKPTALMAYLVRLVTPPGGVVLDPFMGSGSTGKAAVREGFNFIGCELSPEYLSIAEARIQHELAKRQPTEPPPQSDLFAA